MPLTDYTPLLVPVDQDALRREEETLRAIRDRLDEAHDGPLYFPFAFSDRRPVRTAQGYLVKFPAAIVDAFEELEGLPRPSGRTRPPRTTPRPGPETGDAGYQTDPRVRSAIEAHAIDSATAYFAALGYEVENVGSFEPFDLIVTTTTETRHVEVKGSSGNASTVELTHGEVRNARDHQPTDLFIVDSIDWWREPDGSIRTEGGNERVLHDWAPASDLLLVTRYRYTVPQHW